ncbi:MAG: lipoyl(octanoyl) transferase LipB [Alphaproteobacteria bacterium]
MAAQALAGSEEAGRGAEGDAAPARPGEGPVAWRLSRRPVAYEEAVAAMEARVAAIRAGRAAELVWLLEHPPLVTAGTSAKPEDLLEGGRFPVYRSGRGGQFTYHGPGQRVAYVMLDLRRRGGDVRRYVHDLEEWIIRTLARLGVKGGRRQGRIGIWVERGGGREDKIGAIGVRISRWVTYHGMALNRDPALEHFSAIVPCGIAEPQFGVTSLAALGVRVSAETLDGLLKQAFAEVFEAEAAALGCGASTAATTRR